MKTLLLALLILLAACTPTPLPPATVTLAPLPTTTYGLTLTPVQPGHTPPLFLTATAVHQPTSTLPTPTQEVWTQCRVVAPAGLNVRVYPSVTATIRGRLVYGTEVLLLEGVQVVDGYHWVELMTGGFVAREFVECV